MAFLMQSAHAKSTMVKRSTAWNRWTEFAAMQKGVDIYRPSELDLCLWVTYMKTKQYQYKTIKSYVSAVATELKMKGRQCPVLSEAWYYQTSMRGILRTVGEGQGTRRRALTVDMLPAFFSTIDTTAYDSLLMGTMVVVGVFGLFRVGEICYSSTNKEGVIRIMDVKWSEAGMTIRLRSSKTDIGKAGINS